MISGNTIMYVQQFETPLGEMLACAVDEGLCFLEYIDGRESATVITKLKQEFNAQITEASNKHIDVLKTELNEYFGAKRKKFTVPLVFVGTDFQKSVWNELLNIPYGSTRSYKQQALALNNLLAIRAVAHANGTNKIAILVPCHRVIGEDGGLTGYAGGLWRKKHLLDLERGHHQAELDL